MTTHAPASSGSTFVGFALILIIAILLCGLCAAVWGQSGSPPLPPPPAPTATVAPVVVPGTVPAPLPDPAFVPVVVAPPPPVLIIPEPTFEGEVDGFKVPVRCIGNIEMGGSRVKATGTESVANAQGLHEKALKHRSGDFAAALCTTRALSAPPTVVTRTVTVPVLVATPPFAGYTVIGPTMVRDPYGRRWIYSGGYWHY